MQIQIKILHTEWSDGWGGQEIRIINEMLAIREQSTNKRSSYKQDVEVFLACKEGAQIKDKALAADIPVYTLPFRGNADLITLVKLVKLIKDLNINIINTHSGKDTWVGGLAAKLAGIKFIRTRHLSNAINPSRTNFINELADFIFTTGESVRQNMINNNRIPADKIMSVPTGIDEHIFNPEQYNKYEQRQLLGFKQDDIIVGIVAVLRGFKRHDLFLQMAKAVLKKFPGIKFVIAGEGPQRPKIEQLILDYGLQESVIMPGHVDNVPEYLSILDIFVLSSDSNEGVPQSVMQALMMSLPVIATDVGGTRDLLHQENFILIPPNDVNTMINKVTCLVEDEQLRNSYGNKARKYVMQYFSATAMVKKIMKIYQQLNK